MNIPTTIVTYLRHVATSGQVSFLAPGLALSGAPYNLVASHEVQINGASTTNPYTYNSGTGVLTFTNGLTVGDIVEIWRRSEVDESLVEFPVATKWTPKANNKSVTQLLMLIQELWGGLKEAEASQGALEETLKTYVNNAVASVFAFSGIAGATWSTTVDVGDDTLATPYKFTNGVLMVGGSMYNLSDPTHVTLDNSGEFTVISFPSAFVVSHEAILIIF